MGAGDRKRHFIVVGFSLGRKVLGLRETMDWVR